MKRIHRYLDELARLEIFSCACIEEAFLALYEEKVGGD